MLKKVLIFRSISDEYIFSVTRRIIVPTYGSITAD